MFQGLKENHVTVNPLRFGHGGFHLFIYYERFKKIFFVDVKNGIKTNKKENGMYENVINTFVQAYKRLETNTF